MFIQLSIWYLQNIYTHFNTPKCVCAFHKHFRKQTFKYLSLLVTDMHTISKQISDTLCRWWVVSKLHALLNTTLVNLMPISRIIFGARSDSKIYFIPSVFICGNYVISHTHWISNKCYVSTNIVHLCTALDWIFASYLSYIHRNVSIQPSRNSHEC